MLKCCGRLIKPKRFTFTDDDGLKVVRVGFCSNPNCAIPVIEIEKLSLFGRTGKQTLRGKRARNFLEANRIKFIEDKRYRQFKPNTAKGFHYSTSFWDFKENKIKIEHRELATDRLVKRETLDLEDLRDVG